MVSPSCLNPPGSLHSIITHTHTKLMSHIRTCGFRRPMSDRLLNRYIKSQAMLCCAAQSLAEALNAPHALPLRDSLPHWTILFRRPPPPYPNPSSRGHFKENSTCSESTIWTSAKCGELVAIAPRHRPIEMKNGEDHDSFCTCHFEEYRFSKTE